MAATQAVKVALEILHVPSRVKAAVERPLPDGVDELLAIAAGDRECLARAASQTERPEATIRDAAKFFIEQILLGAHTDSYRVLGATPEISAPDLRRNMANLVKWLHPDAGVLVDRPAITGRVNQAWDDLKTPERRTAYDALLLRKKNAAHKPGKRSRDAKLDAKRRFLNSAKPTLRNPAPRWRRALMILLGREDH